MSPDNFIKFQLGTEFFYVVAALGLAGIGIEGSVLDVASVSVSGAIGGLDPLLILVSIIVVFMLLSALSIIETVARKYMETLAYPAESVEQEDEEEAQDGGQSQQRQSDQEREPA